MNAYTKHRLKKALKVFGIISLVMTYHLLVICLPVAFFSLSWDRTALVWILCVIVAFDARQTLKRFGYLK